MARIPKLSQLECAHFEAEESKALQDEVTGRCQQTTVA